MMTVNCLQSVLCAHSRQTGEDHGLRVTLVMSSLASQTSVTRVPASTLNEDTISWITCALFV